MIKKKGVNFEFVSDSLKYKICNYCVHNVDVNPFFERRDLLLAFCLFEQELKKFKVLNHKKVLCLARNVFDIKLNELVFLKKEF